MVSVQNSAACSAAFVFGTVYKAMLRKESKIIVGVLRRPRGHAALPFVILCPPLSLRLQAHDRLFVVHQDTLSSRAQMKRWDDDVAMKKRMEEEEEKRKHEEEEEKEKERKWMEITQKNSEEKIQQESQSDGGGSSQRGSQRGSQRRGSQRREVEEEEDDMDFAKNILTDVGATLRQKFWGKAHRVAVAGAKLRSLASETRMVDEKKEKRLKRERALAKGIEEERKTDEREEKMVNKGSSSSDILRMSTIDMVLNYAGDGDDSKVIDV